MTQPEFTVDKRGNIFCDGKQMKPRSDGRGYLCFTHKGKTRKAHGVVCTCAHGQKPSPHHVPMHRNNIKTDNRPENLYWGTRSENLKHAHESGAMKKNKARPVRCSHPSAVWNHPSVFDSVNQAAIRVGLSPGTIASAASGKSKTAAGLFWEYVLN